LFIWKFNRVLFSLNKDENQRPKYKKLLEHSFVQKAKEEQQAENIAVYLSEIIDGLSENTDTFEQYYYLPSNCSASSNSRWLSCVIGWILLYSIIYLYWKQSLLFCSYVYFDKEFFFLCFWNSLFAHYFILMLSICGYFSFFW